MTTATKPTLPIPDSIAKPLYAYVGAGDAALEVVRGLPATYQAAAKARQDSLTTQVKELRGVAEAQVKELPATVKELRGTARTQVKELPATVKELRGTARTQVKDIPELVKALPAKAPGLATELQAQLQGHAKKDVAFVKGQLEELRGLATPETVSKLQKEATDRVAGLQKETTDRVAGLQKEATDRFAKLSAQLTESYEKYATRGEKLVASLRGTEAPAAPAKPVAKAKAAPKAAAKAAASVTNPVTKPVTKPATKPATEPTTKPVAKAKPAKKAAPAATPVTVVEETPAILTLPTEAGDSETIATPLGTVHVPALDA
jgi:hypothetical protein